MGHLKSQSQNVAPLPICDSSVTLEADRDGFCGCALIGHPLASGDLINIIDPSHTFPALHSQAYLFLTKLQRPDTDPAKSKTRPIPSNLLILPDTSSSLLSALRCCFLRSTSVPTGHEPLQSRTRRKNSPIQQPLHRIQRLFSTTHHGFCNGSTTIHPAAGPKCFFILLRY